jgi:hypothetical protein
MNANKPTRFTTLKPCPVCKTSTSVLVTEGQNEQFPEVATHLRHSSVWFRAWIDQAGRHYPADNGFLVVPCRGCQKLRHARSVRGKFVESKKCDRRCTGAKGHDCECSCGGHNHGADHSI